MNGNKGQNLLVVEKSKAPYFIVMTWISLCCFILLTVNWPSHSRRVVAEWLMCLPLNLGVMDLSPISGHLSKL